MLCLRNTLKKNKKNKESVRIHRVCQKDLYNELKRKISVPETVPVKVAKVDTRLAVGSTFTWKKDCFLCEKPCAIDPKHFNRSDCHQVTSLPFKNKILEVCSERDDNWGLEVQRKALDCHDHIAEEARYHEGCHRNFFLGRAKTDSSQQSASGRPTDQNSYYFFNQVCEWLEKEGDLKSVQEIHPKMVEMAASIDKVYTKNWLKQKLKDKYQNRIFFAEINGKHNVVCFKNMVDYLINDKWYVDRKENSAQEADRIVLTDAKIILNDIRSREFYNQWYLTNEVLESCENGKDWLPYYLRLILESIIKYPIKPPSIGQAIVGAIRPRSSECN